MVGFNIGMGKIRGQEGKGEAEVTKEEITGYREKCLKMNINLIWTVSFTAP
jgi:hypothetical protein